MKNQKGISLIALIITIIVIIILAAIVISSAVNTPEQANWAKFCGNYAEIQSAVSTKSAEVYGNAMLSTATAAKPSMTEVLVSVCTEGSLTVDGTYTAFPSANGANALPISNTNQLGLSGYTFGTDEWAVKSDGVLYNVSGVSNPNASNTLYSTPTITTTAAALDIDDAA
jgi:hypothetical protein